jgi:sec-independent protein translocase protein TatA
MFAGIASPTHLLILLMIVLLLFGAKRIPDLARSLGRGAREFQEGISAAAGDDDKDEEKPSLDKAAHGKTPRAEEAGATGPMQKS